MRKWLRVTRRVVVVLGLLVCAAYLTLLAYGAVQLRRAQRFVSTLSSVRLGVPFAQQPGAALFTGAECIAGGSCDVKASFSNVPFTKRWPARERAIPKIAFINWWFVNAAIKLDASGNAVEKRLIVDDGKYYQFPTIWLVELEDDNAFDPCLHVEQTRHPGYRSLREIRTGALWIKVSPSADERFLRRAFDLRLSCLNSLAGCENPGDIAPAAWQDQANDRTLAKTDTAQRPRFCAD
jgi:hypothetical protein